MRVRDYYMISTPTLVEARGEGPQRIVQFWCGAQTWSARLEDGALFARYEAAREHVKSLGLTEWQIMTLKPL